MLNNELFYCTWQANEKPFRQLARHNNRP